MGWEQYRNANYVPEVPSRPQRQTRPPIVGGLSTGTSQSTASGQNVSGGPAAGFDANGNPIEGYVAPVNPQQVAENRAYLDENPTAPTPGRTNTQDFMDYDRHKILQQQGGSGSMTIGPQGVPESPAYPGGGPLRVSSGTMGGGVSPVDIKENQKLVYNPDPFLGNANAFKFDQQQKWADLYGGQAGQYGGRADQAWADQAGIRGQQGNLLGMTMDMAAGRGPSAAQGQFQRNLDQSIAATRSAMAGQRGMSAGSAARMGSQAIGDMGLRGAADAATLRAQEQQQAMGMAGNLANQIRAGDTGLYGGNLAAQQAAQASGLNLDQQSLALKQQEEQYKYNQWRDYQDMMTRQYSGVAGAGYQAPWQDQAWMNIAAGAVGGLAQGAVDWATR